MKGSQCDRRGNNSGEYEWRANRHGMGEFSNVLLAVMARACYVAKICVDPAAPMT